MDHNLDDSLNMETIDAMDFDHSGVVNQEDITLEDNQEGMSMELDTIEEQPTLMESGHEEIIVSDMIGSDQYTFEEYTLPQDNSTGANITIEANQLNELSTPNEPQLDVQFADNINVSTATTSQHNIITIKAINQRQNKKQVTTTFPRQVAIAPKPTKGAPNVRYAIAPKPVTLVAVNKPRSVQAMKPNTVLAQLGKQLVMVPASAAGQKIKLSSLLQSSANKDPIQILRCNTDQAQLIANKGAAKTVRTKFIVQGATSKESGSPAVITKLVGAPKQPRYVMQQKTVPISIPGNKVMLATPPKTVKVAPKTQIISLKPQSPTVVTSQANITTKKVVISANPSQNVILKAKAVNPQAKSTSLIQTQQRTQLHPINIPGKGIQLVKLVTNQAGAGKPPPLALSGKNFVLTDSKGNIIQMSAEKVLSSQPPPLIVTSAPTLSTPKLATKAKKLRIAPISIKGETTTITPARSSQSLLAPIETPTTTVSLEEYNNMVEQNNLKLATVPQNIETNEENDEAQEGNRQSVDVKPTLASLISDAVGGEESFHEHDTHINEVEIEYDNSMPQKKERVSGEDQANNMDHETSYDSRLDENVIIVPSNITVDSRQHEDSYQDESNVSMDNQGSENADSSDVLHLLSPKASQNYDDSSAYSLENKDMPELRARKACNCTKSQCLKLYCDCFANGEFCNNCNCNNCQNNLDYEELRQKAIRACLERNPNAFRPKIGKGKTGGPEIIRRHNKGCNCKRSGCLKNYCECYEAKIACTLMCKCVGCRNIHETLERRRNVRIRAKESVDTTYRPPLSIDAPIKQPCSFMTPEVIEAVSQCMLATVAEGSHADPVEDILVEFSRCMADIITASHHAL